MENIKTAIIGYGWVGKAVQKLFPNSKLYDPNLGMGSQENINECDIAFICVPTPYKTDSNGIEGSLDTSIVEEVVSWCKCPLIVIRSTINPGTCDMLNAKYRGNIVFQPEYLGETPQHPLLDQKMSPFLIIGGEPKDRRKLIDLYTTVYNANIKIRQVSNLEAEVIKLTENRAIAFKVAQCQELYDVCEKEGLLFQEKKLLNITNYNRSPSIRVTNRRACIRIQRRLAV